MAYTLYNKLTEKQLVHPVCGLWYTKDLKEADEMLKACYEYLDNEGLEDLKPYIYLVDAQTNEYVVPLAVES